jgi:hypothetical protein
MTSKPDQLIDDSKNFETGQPVAGFPLEFRWRAGAWKAIFDRQIQLLQDDIARARADGRLVLYLSCPISSRGGSWAGTNVDIARHVEREILQRLGESFWVLNPAQYQLESKAGLGLLEQHAKAIGINLADLKGMSPGGGDYMRMWTRVLVEDGEHNLGRNFDAYYFLGPRDVLSFFTANGSETLTAGVQGYFARKMEADGAFRHQFSAPDTIWNGNVLSEAEEKQKLEWVRKRKDFLCYYGLKASANFSLGSHDEWAILRLLNQARRKASASADKLDGDVGDQIAALFDGSQVSLSASEAPLSRGYAL